MSTLDEYQKRVDAEIERDTRRLLARSFQCPSIKRKEWQKDRLGILTRFAARMHDERELVRLRSSQIITKITCRDDPQAIEILSRSADNLLLADRRYTDLIRQARLVRRALERA